ncbi:MAG: 4Fe-4S double cluster binding domain-containing protein [Bacillota bacterium]
MNIFCEKLGEVSDFYFGFSAGVEYIVCVAPYKRTMPLGGDFAYIDGYYEVSNSQYHKAKDFIAFCNKNGCGVEIEREKSYKDFLFENGFFQRGKNTLLQDSVFGSKIYFTVLKVVSMPKSREERLEFVKFLQILKSKQSRFKSNGDTCKDCNICISACPQKALPLSLQTCLRQHMQNGEIREEFSLSLGSRVLGCEICSEVCPKNKGVEISCENQFELTNLLALVEKKNPSLCEKYGKNIIAKNKLVPYIINAMGNTRKEKYSEILEKYSNSQSEKIAFSARLALSKIKGELHE